MQVAAGVGVKVGWKEEGCSGDGGLGGPSFGTGKRAGLGDVISLIRNMEGTGKVLVLAAAVPWGGIQTRKAGPQGTY